MGIIIHSIQFLQNYIHFITNCCFLINWLCTYGRVSQDYNFCTKELYSRSFDQTNSKTFRHYLCSYMNIQWSIQGRNFFKNFSSLFFQLDYWLKNGRGHFRCIVYKELIGLLLIQQKCILQYLHNRNLYLLKIRIILLHHLYRSDHSNLDWKL